MRLLPACAGRTVGDLVRAAIAAGRDRPYLCFGEHTYTYGDLGTAVERAAAGFAAAGIGRGDRVVFVLPNCPEFVFLWLGLASIGGVLVAADARSTAAEIAGLLAESRPRAVVAAGAVGSAASEPAALLDPRALLDHSHPAAAPAAVRGSDPLVLLATSGTTGAPKLVIQTHRAYVLAAEAFPWWLGIDERDRLLTCLPLTHLNAQAYTVLGAAAAGASVALVDGFSATGFWAETRRHGATQFNAVGSLLEILMRRPPRPDDADNPVRLCYTAPAPAGEGRHLEIERRFDIRVTAGYALSETPFGTVWPRTGPRPYGSIGRPRQHPALGRINEARIVDESGDDVAPGATGELLLRNPAVMAGYFNRPGETAATLAGGWLHTGDLVRAAHSGDLYFVARKKEVIRRRGENIAPAEVEDALLSHPKVVEAAVVGVESDLGEQDVKAFVVPTGDVTPDELTTWCAARLSRFKLPRFIEFVERLPRTPTGRIAKHLLSRARTEAEHDDQSSGFGHEPRPADESPD